MDAPPFGLEPVGGNLVPGSAEFESLIVVTGVEVGASGLLLGLLGLATLDALDGFSNSLEEPFPDSPYAESG